MGSFTVRTIPEQLLERLRALAAAERRSLNSEILVLLERAIGDAAIAERRPQIASDVQLRMWEDLCGRWEDERDWEQIARDIVSHRTTGRTVKL